MYHQLLFVPLNLSFLKFSQSMKIENEIYSIYKAWGGLQLTVLKIIIVVVKQHVR